MEKHEYIYKSRNNENFIILTIKNKMTKFNFEKYILRQDDGRLPK